MELEEVRNHLAIVLTTNAYINICKSTDLIIAINAIEKQIPQKPDKYGEDSLLCPLCNSFLGYESECKDGWYQTNHCGACGQAIDWGE